MLTDGILVRFSQKVVISISIALLLCLASTIQKSALAFLSFGPRASLFYLPAAVITLGSLVSPVSAMIGIVTGAMLFNSFNRTFEHLGDMVLVSTVPALAAGFAVVTTYLFSPRFREFHQPKDRFSQIDGLDIFYFCSLYAFSNLALSEFLNYFTNQDPIEFPPMTVFGMIFGDLTGSFLGFVAINLLFSLYIRLR